MPVRPLPWALIALSAAACSAPRDADEVRHSEPNGHEEFVVEVTVYEPGADSAPEAYRRRARIEPSGAAFMADVSSRDYVQDVCKANGDAAAEHALIGQLRTGQRIAITLGRNADDAWSGVLAFEEAAVVTIESMVAEAADGEVTLELPEVHAQARELTLEPNRAGHWVLHAEDLFGKAERRIEVRVVPHESWELFDSGGGLQPLAALQPAELGEFFAVQHLSCTVHDPAR
ncbi:MAG TPA: hypothetical protein VGC54_15285 [Planctomycetota bacterium]